MNLFEDLGLGPDVLRAVADSGYTTPTPIQEKAIPHILRGRDILGVAQTGTGKTASFTLPMIDILSQGRAKARMPRTLILEPTRELAAQVAENFERYGKYHKLSMALIIGGVAFGDQDKKLDRGVDVLIATPGRLIDQFERGRLMMSGVQILVIDEADRMLDMGFIPDIERICKMLPFTRQTLFFSATMPAEITRLADQFLNNPVRIEAARPATTAATIDQQLVFVGEEDKREALRRLLRGDTVTNAIIFCNRKRDVDVVAKSLVKHGFNAAALHGDLDQSVRTRTLDSFRSGELLFLVASDVAARGLDIPAVSHVFNFDVPIHSDDYVHRIGRTGRAGRPGTSIMIATTRDLENVADIEKLTDKPINRMTIEGLSVDPSAPTDANAEGRSRDHRNVRGRGGKATGRGASKGASRGGKPREHAVSHDPVVTPAPTEEPVAVTAEPEILVESPTIAIPAEATVEVSAQAVRAPRVRRNRRDRRPSPSIPAEVAAIPESEAAERASPPQSTRNTQTPKDHPPRERGQNRNETPQSVMGFGDAMPAFMRQTVKFTTAPRSDDEIVERKKEPASVE